MRSGRRSILVLVASLLVATVGCDLAETSSSGDGNGSSSRPDRLAFVLHEPTEAGNPTTTGPAGPMTATEGVHVHSGPDALYTRITWLLPGAVVEATGIQVDRRSVLWIEVETAAGQLGWVDATALAETTRN